MIPDRDIWRAANLLIREHGVRRRSLRPGEPMKCSNAAIMRGNLSGFVSGGQSPSFRQCPKANRISRLSPRQVQLEICSLPGECGFLTVLERDLRDLDRLVAVLALVLRRVFRALLFGLAFLTVAFLALVRV